MNPLILVLMTLTMAAVTYLIRMIPFVFFRKKIKSKFIKSLLYYIPYAVLAAMTFPSIFYSTGNIITACIGTVAAIIAASSKASLIVVALIAVAAVLICTPFVALF